MQLNALFECTDEQFVLNCYHLILGREPDEEGYLHHINMLQRGRSRLRVVRGMARSSEARRLGVRVTGLRRAIIWQWLIDHSYAGRWLSRTGWARRSDETLKRIWSLEARCSELVQIAANEAALREQRLRHSQVEANEAASWLSPRGIEIFNELRG